MSILEELLAAIYVGSPAEWERLRKKLGKEEGDGSFYDRYNLEDADRETDNKLTS